MKPTYDSLHPGTSARQISMILDLNKCLGCHTCTIACKTLWTRGAGQEGSYFNNVETRPGAGFPRNWADSGGRDHHGNRVRGELPDTARDYGTGWKFNHHAAMADPNWRKTWLKPERKVEWGPNWDEEQGAGVYPEDNYYFFLPRLCNHCTKPACLEACPRGAIKKRTKDGIVYIDGDQCRGYRFCLEACPYKKVYYNAVRSISEKCIFCFPRVEKGKPTACARQCPGRLRHIGFLDDKESHIYKLVKKWKVALPLHAEYGTQPNVFYVPPDAPARFDEPDAPRIPPAYLEQLFGPQVHTALQKLRTERDKKRRGEESELMDILIAWRWSDNFALGEDA